MHKQKEIKINVDEKIQPIIQYIFDNLPGLIPTASCQGGNSELNESDDSYILLIVQNINQLNQLMDICSCWHCQYIKPDLDTGNIPMFRLSINNLDETLKSLEL
jgi:hypothetical protein